MYGDIVPRDEVWCYLVFCLNKPICGKHTTNKQKLVIDAIKSRII